MNFVKVIISIFSILAFSMLSGCSFLQQKEETQTKAGPAQTILKEVKTVQVVEKKVPAAQTAEPKKKSLKDIIRDSQDKVFQIITPDGLGSGFLYDNKGHIVTNAHVVAGYKDVEVLTVDDTSLHGTVIGIGEALDVAVIEVPELAGKGFLQTAAAMSEKGQEVITFGSPKGLKDSVSEGIISGIDRSFEIPPFVYENIYQTTAPIWPGSSGGPLLNKDNGEVMAINSASYINEEALGFSIPIQQAVPLIDSWIQNPMDLDQLYDYGNTYSDTDVWDIPDEAYEEDWDSTYDYSEEEGTDSYPEESESDEEYYNSDDSSGYGDYETADPEAEEYITPEEEDPAVSDDELNEEPTDEPGYEAVPEEGEGTEEYYPEPEDPYNGEDPLSEEGQ
ncbi:S1-C subfamily serine protease [Peribacillus deserti]|uniref:S1-C subfamily serine protease n=1 Tax=Peribacillus deserti TaxID=673318 RepID=A0ABS2QCF4_9BACI|nr:trypsin-like peptidase domain-containing protein [Peribacillus deserti]MBM7690843.1 S1-C subfamily serine protease [Peribacillus deserti]